MIKKKEEKTSLPIVVRLTGLEPARPKTPDPHRAPRKAPWTMS